MASSLLACLVVVHVQVAWQTVTTELPAKAALYRLMIAIATWLTEQSWWLTCCFLLYRQSQFPADLRLWLLLQMR